MIGVLVETVVVAFIMGGIIGAVTALHLGNPQNNEPKKIPVNISENQNRSNRC